MTYQFKDVHGGDIARIGCFKGLKQVGYYRQTVLGDKPWVAVLYGPISNQFSDSQDFLTEEEAQNWLKERSKYY
jgi:hypothetical protein